MRITIDDVTAGAIRRAYDAMLANTEASDLAYLLDVADDLHRLSLLLRRVGWPGLPAHPTRAALERHEARPHRDAG